MQTSDRAAEAMARMDMLRQMVEDRGLDSLMVTILQPSPHLFMAIHSASAEQPAPASSPLAELLRQKGAQPYREVLKDLQFCLTMQQLVVALEHESAALPERLRPRATAYTRATNALMMSDPH